MQQRTLANHIRTIRQSMGSVDTKRISTARTPHSVLRYPSLAALGLFIFLAPTTYRARACTLPTYDPLPIEKLQSIVRSRETDLFINENQLGLAYLAPHRMSFQLRHDSEFDRSGTLYEDGWRRSMDDDSQWSWRLELEWDLSRLIFNPVELTLARLKADLRRRADNAVDLATRLYFERFSIVAEAPLATAKQCVSLRKRFLLLDSRLKALTQTERPNTRKLEPGSNGPYTVDNEH